MASTSQPPGEVRVDAHSLIRLRERTVYPQLTDVPSDLRVNGARHASRESLPPSKPCRPQRGAPGGPELNQRLRSPDASAIPHSTASSRFAPGHQPCSTTAA